jgi:hypothetical protein
MANAKALIFAGSYFQGPEADQWRRIGLSVLSAQLPVQVLSDGGHYELSPMYHSIILEDLLDLVNLRSLMALQEFSSGFGSVHLADARLAVCNDSSGWTDRFLQRCRNRRGT